MLDQINNLTPVQSVLFAIGLIALIFIIILSIIIGNKSNLSKARDGSTFKTKDELKSYEALVDKLSPIFNELDKENNQTTRLDLNIDFINTLKGKGFKNVQMLIKYKNEFQKLSLLINGNHTNK